MADTGWKIAGSGTNIDNPETAYVSDWFNPSNITTTTIDTFATATHGGGRQFSDVIYASNFGFLIPSEAAIKGVEVRCLCSSDNGATSDSFIRLIVAGSLVGVSRAKGSSSKWPASPVDRDYGSSSDLWGVSVTPTIANTSQFGCGLSANGDGKNNSRVHAVWMRIHYEEPGSFYERVAGTWRKGQLYERVSGVYRPGKLYERIGGIWRS